MSAPIAPVTSPQFDAEIQRISYDTVMIATRLADAANYGLAVMTEANRVKGLCLRPCAPAAPGMPTGGWESMTSADVTRYRAVLTEFQRIAALLTTKGSGQTPSAVDSLRPLAGRMPHGTLPPMPPVVATTLPTLPEGTGLP